VGTVTGELEARLRAMIESDYRPGQKLPSERAIAAEFGVGRTTVRLVLTKLAAKGLIEPQHGRGYFVCFVCGSPE
jgi:DNA-binding FadR family transcriptional regulator